MLIKSGQEFQENHLHTLTANIKRPITTMKVEARLRTIG